MGRAPFVVPAAGHEGCQVGTAWAMRQGIDVWLPYYRDLGVVLAAGMTPYEVFLGVFAKADDPSSGGRQMPAHWGSRRLSIISGSSPIATQVPHAAGIAWAARYRGEDAVVGCWFGDGATSEGDWHEGLNFAGIHRLPVIFVCENNQYAISVPQSKQMAVEDVAYARGGLRVPRGGGGRERRARLLRRDEAGPRARPRRRGSHADRVQDLPVPRPYLRRRRQDLPATRGGRGGARATIHSSCSASTCVPTKSSMIPGTRRCARRRRRRSRKPRGRLGCPRPGPRLGAAARLPRGRQAVTREERRHRDPRRPARRDGRRRPHRPAGRGRG